MQSVDALVLRSAGVSTALVGVLSTVVSGVVAGVPGAVGGVLGTLIVLAFFSVGQFVLGRVLRDNPQMAMTVAMTLYLVKIGVLFGLIVLFAGTTAFNTKAFGLTIVACTLTWTIAEVWVFSRTKVLYVEPDTSSTGKGSEGSS